MRLPAEGFLVQKEATVASIAKSFLLHANNCVVRRRQRKMNGETVLMKKRKKIALVAHDHKKEDLLEWVKFNKYLLSLHELYATGTTGKIIEKAGLGN